MGKALAIAAVTFISLGTYYSASRNVSQLETSRRISNSQYEALSRNAALAGFNVIRQRLASTWASSTLKGTHQGGAYAVSAKVLGPKQAVVEAIGTIRNAGRMSENYSIRVTVERRLALPDPPIWGQYALVTDNDIDFSGTVMVAGDPAIKMNANVHTNGTMKLAGNSNEFAGFGTYSDGADGKEEHFDEAFDPTYNAIGHETHYQSDQIDIPSFGDVDYLTAVDEWGNPLVDATSSTTIDLSGNYDFGGTREDPYVWYIDGDLNVTGNTTIDGYVLFVVNGSVAVKGDLVTGDSGYDGGTESSIGVTSSGSFTTTGNATVEAQIFAGGDIITDAKGTPTLRGSLTAKGKVDLRGTPKIYYRPATSALTKFWQADYKFSYHATSHYEE